MAIINQKIGIAELRTRMGCSQNKWLKQRNSLAMSADWDIPDKHHLRENTRDPSFYGGVEQFTAAPK
jgi:hypothetical protein